MERSISAGACVSVTWSHFVTLWSQLPPANRCLQLSQHLKPAEGVSGDQIHRESTRFNQVMAADETKGHSSMLSRTRDYDKQTLDVSLTTSTGSLIETKNSSQHASTNSAFTLCWPKVSFMHDDILTVKPDHTTRTRNVHTTAEPIPESSWS